jgi:RHS repeat-associated protein
MTRFSFVALIAIVLLAVVAPSRPAHALGTGTKGWCTVIAAGTEQCGFTNALEACYLQWRIYGAPVTDHGMFYGAQPTDHWNLQQCKWKNVIGYAQASLVTFRCDTGYVGSAPGYCVPTAEDYPLRLPQSCTANNGGTPNPSTAHPIDILTGSKRFEVTDFETADGSLRLRRMYATRPNGGTKAPEMRGIVGLGNWAFDFQYEMQIPTAEWSGYKNLALVTPSGASYDFQRQSDGSMKPYTNSLYPLAHTDYTLQLNGPWPTNLADINTATSIWSLRDPDGAVWTMQTFLDAQTGKYDVAYPTAMTTREGLVWTFAYGSKNELISIADSYGKAIVFTWNYVDPSTLGSSDPAFAITIKRATLPSGDTLDYGYSQIGSNSYQFDEPQRLSQVQYFEQVGGVPTLRDLTSYDYDNTDFPFYVTGVRDKDDVLRWKVSYDSAGHVLTSQGPNGEDAVTMSYGAGNTTFTNTATNAAGKVTSYNYTNSYPWYKARLVGVNGAASTNCPSTTSSITYDANNFIATTTDQEGRVTSYTRNSRGLATQIVEAYGTSLARTTTITWPANDNVPSEVVRAGMTTDYGYTGNKLTSITQTDTTTTSIPYSTNGQTRTWGFSWSSTGQLLSVDGPLAGSGDTISYAYRSDGYLDHVRDELGHVTQIVSVNGRGQPTEMYDANGITTQMVYDALGRVQTITRNPGASQAVTSFNYDAVGDVSEVTAPDGVVLDYTYDDTRRLTSVTDSAGEHIDYTYNALSKVTDVNAKTAAGTVMATQHKVYDELGRLLQSIGASSQTTAFAYDKVDNLVSVTDPRIKVYGHTFDALNRFTRETDPDLYQINMAYNAKDEATSVTDARSLATTYVRDGFGDVIRQSSPDGGVTDFWYDAAGNVTKKIDARSVETDFSYDAASRLLTKTFPTASGEDVSYAYDSTANANVGIGRLTSVSDASGSTSFQYDALGHVVSDTRVIGANSYPVLYAFDAAGNVLSVTYPSGRITTFVRDSLGRISGVSTQQNSTAASVAIASSVSYLPFGPLAGMTFGNGVTLSLTYDRDYTLTGLNSSTASSVIQDLTYGVDAAGNVTSITDALDSARDQSFTYDNINRLATANGLYGSQTYTYDGVGNRLIRTIGTTTDTYAYNLTSNQIQSITTGSAVRNISYASSGQVVQDGVTGAVTTFTLNANGRISSAQYGVTALGTYSYNAFEQRVAKTTASGTTQLIYDRAGHLLEQANGAGAVRFEYIWLDDLPVAMVDNTGASPTIYYIHTDHLGRPQKITDGSATIVSNIAFDPFGNLTSATGSPFSHLMFPGQYLDDETELFQNWHRDYDPTTGRYVESDPIGLRGGINTYAYVEANPLARTDPRGLYVTYSGDPTGVAAILDAMKNIKKTARGAAMCESMESSPFEYKIRANQSSINNGSARTRQINIDADPAHRPTIETTAGAMPSSLEGMVAHEIGHAVTGIEDEVTNMQQNENPVLRELGLPQRTKY